MKVVPVIIRCLGLVDWNDIYIKMNHFTNIRNQFSLDEIWFVEHYPIFTQGYVESNIQIKNINMIPLMKSNRGGKITYHGPGQQIIYFLLNLIRLKITVKKLLCIMENIILSTLYDFSILGVNNDKYPGIYVNNQKICSLGLKIKNNYCFHGLALNVNMNLNPFKYIQPCGNNIIMTQMSNIKKDILFYNVRDILVQKCLFFFNLKNFLYS
ncbi:lipoyl(octanoyl) transferase LipB [Buchnera aphidicola]|uniref:Octanoyltransferase n=1 Tax=Buchnera aphidicola (Stegophylla sp.) TaxID=2315800 RepID=A0A4D6YKI3_9GAMM|nr:lipoyl(octanoyl) transferase LipB [Buchnera aphidicola (Stegophylla sp.)]QCI26350.1 lipoyl(octanoyl) transferase [Buchnera aphidicola (Stegophylla sp.)]